MQIVRSFASDNTSGAHPRVMEALSRANTGTSFSYGADPATREVTEALQAVFGAGARPWFVFLGTAANVLGLKSVARSHNAILCAETAHLNTDECGAAEALVGAKLLCLPSYHGKVLPQDCLPLLARRDDVHHNHPNVLSITQSTECGTVYTLSELRAIHDFCQTHELYLHMDGARLSNAAAALDCSLQDIVTEAGVDVLSFGGTKNGLLFGEVVVFLNENIGHDFAYIRKQHLQLMSKMRFLAAQFQAYLEDGLWLENARTANRMAAMLADALKNMEHVRIVHPVEVNAIFARLHKNAIAKLQERFYFYLLDTADAKEYPADWHLVRLMTSFNTTEDEVAEFVEAIGSCRDIR